MQAHVARNQDRAGRPPSANSNRALAGHSAKMPVPNTRLQKQPPQIHPAAPRHPNNPFQVQADSTKLAQFSLHGQQQEADEASYGRFDTDAGSSIDTTIHEQSNLNEQAFQQPDQPRFPNEHAEIDQHLNENEPSNGEDSDDETSETDDDDQEGHQSQDEYQDTFKNEAMAVMEATGLFRGNDSYPATTSGGPSEVFEMHNVGQQMSIDPAQHHYAATYSQQVAPVMATNQQPRTSAAQSTYPTTAQRGKGRRDMFKEGSDARTAEQFAKLSANAITGGASHTKAAVPNLDRSSNQVQAAPQVHRQAGLATAHQSFGSTGQFRHQQAVPATTQPLPTSTQRAPASAVNPTLPVRSSLLHPQPERQLVQEQIVSAYPSVEEDPVTDDPPDDYDLPALYDMSYEDLRNEDFDKEPRRKDQVLSKDMQQRDLTERLVHVKENHTPKDQTAFFESLRTEEWEEAGDWFLDRFGSIITRVREARQKKRKQAKEFEDEITERYRKVAKRQETVESALGEMQEKGQNLIPKSPRASREPGTKVPNRRNH